LKNISRGITNQNRLENEVWVAVNGPDVVHCEGIVKEAIKEGEGGGHFIRRSQKIKTYQVSKAVDSLVNKPLNVPFMA
jgi:hypothetical protein